MRRKSLLEGGCRSVQSWTQGQACGPIRAKIAGRLDQWEGGTNLKGNVLAPTDLDPRPELDESTGPCHCHWRRNID